MKRAELDLKYLVHVGFELGPSYFSAVILIDLLHDIVPELVILVPVGADESVLQFLFANSAVAISIKYIKGCPYVFVI